MREFHTKLRLRRQRVFRTAAWLAALIPIAALVPLAGPAQQAAASGSGCTKKVVKPIGPFHIAPDKRTILDKKNRKFISYGTTVPGLSNPKQTTVPGTDKPKINATASLWCGNTVRLQVSQFAVTHNTTIDNGGCETGYLNNVLDHEVHKAEQDGLVVVINDQTESDSLGNEEREPTKATFRFWDCVTKHQESWHTSPMTYAQDPQVIFDIFNEPRADACMQDHGPNGPYDLNLWRNGGRSDGKCGPAETYQGMDAVAFHIRNEDSDTKTLLWIEGPGLAGTLAGLAKPECGSTPTGNCFITPALGPLVYAVHHPYGSDVTKKHSPTANPTTWFAEFGWVVAHQEPVGNAPVVVGEWTNFDSFNGAKVAPGASCWSDAPKQVPAFLAYLKSIGVGLNAYQLASPPNGYLLKPGGNFTDTTNYTDAPWKSSYCKPRTAAPLLAAGSLIRSWFQKQN